MTNTKMIHVEVAYALPDEQVVIPLDIPEDATLQQAITLSRIQERFPDIDLSTAKVGIFGKLSHLSVQLRADDRVEIYRPLRADPKAVRKKRAAAGAQKSDGIIVKEV